MVQAMSQLFYFEGPFFSRRIGLAGLLTIFMYDELMQPAINYGFIFVAIIE